VKDKSSLFGGFKKRFRKKKPALTTIAAGDRLRLSGQSLALKANPDGFVLELGKQTIHLCPAHPEIRNEDPSQSEWILFDPELYFSGISHSLRLRPGESLSVDHRVQNQHLAFRHRKHAFRRNLQIRHGGDFLEFQDPISELGTFVSLPGSGASDHSYKKHRLRKLKRLRELLGPRIEPLGLDEALLLLQDVNREIVNDPFRQRDSLDNAGSLLELPVNLTPVIIGDLHGQVNNLLQILIENAVLDSLDKGEGALIFLGDAVHGEEAGQLEDMDSSMLIMDLILRLKRHFPRQVFFLLGNHDSFSPDVMKGGIAQSLLWEKHIVEQRGAEYARQLGIFYRQSPLFVLSRNFMACHAGPPRSKVSRETLIEARQLPELVHELTWNRLKSTNWPMGYTKSDVRRLRKSLDAEDNMPFIVAHYPQAASGSVWLNAGDIPHHHIIYSARPGEAGVFTRVGGEMVAQVYSVHDLQFTINEVMDQAI
jgi:hypothetical protein